MTETTVFHRTKRQLLLTLFSGAILTLASYLNFLDWYVGGRMFPLVVGVGLGVFAVLMWASVIRRRTYGHVGPDGLFVRRPLREFHIPWDALLWAKTDVDAQVNVVAYRLPGDTRDRHTGFVAKTIGQDGVAALRAAIKTYRPDLPTKPPEAAP